MHGHTHNAIHRAHLADGDPDAQWQVVQRFASHGADYRWRQILMDAIDSGAEVAIVSYSEFPHIIARFLREKIQLDESYASQITICSHFPEDMKNGKNEHIQEVMDGKGITIDANIKSNTVLLDDDGNNISQADKVGYQTIFVNHDDTQHLDKLAALVSQNNERLDTFQPKGP